LGGWRSSANINSLVYHIDMENINQFPESGEWISCAVLVIMFPDLF
jgi:hypothetical protein